MLEWFNAKDAVQFGEALAEFFIKRVPLPADGKKERRLDKQFEAVDRMEQQIEQFKAKNKLNVYKKAKLAEAFKAKLTDAGYDPKLVDEVTLGIMKIL